MGLKFNPITVQLDLVGGGGDISGLVPYTGATSAVDLGAFNITVPDVILSGGDIYPLADSTTAIQINKADGTTNVLNVDTTNSRIGIGTNAPSSLLQLLGTSANQFRIGYDSSNYVTDSVSSTGANTLTLNGSNAGYGIILPVSALAGINLIPVMTSATAPSGIAAGVDFDANDHAAWKAFDGSLDIANFHHWTSSSIISWLSYQFTTSQTITQYKLYSANYPTYAPKNWTFEGYNGSSWVVLDTQTNQTNWTTWNTYSFTNTTAYISYRINITANNGAASYDIIDEMQMFATGAANASMLTISNTGVVGINNAAPAYTLDVKGLAGASLFNVANSTGTSELMVSSNGNVGIGTTNPLSKLTVGATNGMANKLLTVSDRTTPSTSAGANGILVDINGGGGIYMTGDNGATRGKYEAFGGQLGVGTMTANPLALFTSNLQRVTIDTAGNVGIGTATPGGSLDVHGAGTTTGVCLQTADSGGNAKFTILDNGAVSAVNQITSTLTTGTSPFAVTSTTVNTNLNADLLDGLHATDLAIVKQNIQLTAKVASIGSTNITGTSTAGLYRVSYNLLDTTADLAAGTIMVNFAGTDEAGAFTMSSVALPLTAVGRTQGTLFLRISNTSSVAYSTTLVGLIGTSQYALFISVEKLL